ncbi:hypothetical protein [Pontibacter mangrovi]|uniref:Uncharacterized protein n=1 Tax=Pontibacter mangrovi TaxID=2589816 RepID=A0A501WGZ4_9BACT|nr:hypothetical protein [Pontibacter mangrovi]TPE46287.1 hypothetical protein FJM65_02790 [Pontibacter mangrovi]
MADVAVLFSVLSIFGILIGLVSPRHGLCWYYGRRNRFNVLRIYLAVLVISFIVFAVTENL